MKNFENFDTLCRICLKEEGPMISIFTSECEENNCQSTIATRITSITPIQMSPDDGLPISICQMCHEQVNKFYDFRLLVETSDQTLRSHLNGMKRSDEVCIDNIENAKDTSYRGVPIIDSKTEDDPKELYAVNTIIIPFQTGTEVWKMSDTIEPRKQKESKTVEKEVHISSECDILEVIESEENTILEERSESEKLEPVALIKNTYDSKSVIFTSKNEDSGKLLGNPEQLSWITMAEKNLAEASNKYSCELCLKSFKTLRKLKSHVKEHFLSGKKRIEINEMKKNKFKIKRISIEDTETLDCSAEENSSIYRTRSRASRSSDEFVRSKRKTEKLNEAEESTKNVNKRSKNCKDCRGEARGSKSHRDQVIDDDSSLTCLKCNKHFRTAQSYNTHSKRHTLGSRFHCTECDKSYYTNAELTRHAQLHTGTRRYPCHLCETSFCSKPELNRHTKYHKGEKKFQCEICLKSYYESGHLKVHQRVHTGEKPFSCNICDKAFITKSKLIRHCKIHEKNRIT